MMAPNLTIDPMYSPFQSQWPLQHPDVAAP